MVLLLSLVTVILSVLPLIHFQTSGIFFGFDPDVVYVANALSYIQSHQIQYTDHPGTPTIWLIAQSFIPLRLYAKYILHQPFITWAFQNFDFIFLYSRLFQSLLFGSAVFIFLTAVWRFSKSKLAAIFAWIALLIFRPTPYLGSIVSPETTSVLIVSFWLLIFTSYYKSRSIFLLVLLAVISGLAFANKITNSALVIASLVLFIKPANLPLSGAAITSGFVLGIWPIRDRLAQIANRIVELFTRTGVHGTGTNSFIDFSAYLANLKTFHFQNPALLPLIVTGLILALIHRKTLRIYLVILFVFFAFFKYSLFHYQLGNLLILIFLTAYYLSFYFKPAIFFLCLMLLWYLPVTVKAYYREVNQLVSQSQALENFIASNPPRVAAAWEWGRARDFAYIWARNWAGGLFDYQLKTYRPDLLELKSDFQTINLNFHDQKPVLTACWDQLYIQQESAPKFLALYPDQLLNYDVIPNTPMALITSAHCLNK